MSTSQKVIRHPVVDPDLLLPLGYVLIYVLTAFYIHWRFFPVGDIGVETDFYGELAVGARKLWAGEFSVLNYPYKGPVYSCILVFVHAVLRLPGGDWYQSGVVLNLFCAGGGLILLYRTLLALVSRHVAWAVMITTSLVYEFFFQAHKASSDLLFFLFFLGAVNRVVGGDLNRRRIIQSAILAGLATLTRYNGFILPVAVIIMLLVCPPEGVPITKKGRLAVLYLGVFLLTLMPWYALNLAETGQLKNTRNLQNIFVEEFWSPDTDAQEKPGSIIEVIRDDPGHALSRYLRNIPDHLNRDLRSTLGWPLGLLSLLGLIRLIGRKHNPRLGAFYLIHALYFLAMCLVYHQPRFFLPLLPSYLAVAMILLFDVVRLIPRGGLTVAVLTLSTLAAWQIRTIIAGEEYYIRQSQAYISAPAAFLADTLPPDSRIMSRKPHLAFTADRQWVVYPAAVGSASHLIKAALDSDATHIATTDVERYYYPEKAFLDHLDRARGVDRIYADNHVIVYRLNRDLPVEEAVQNTIIVRLLVELSAARTDGHRLDAIRTAAEIGKTLLADQEYEFAHDYLGWAIEELEGLDISVGTHGWLEKLYADYQRVQTIIGSTESTRGSISTSLSEIP